MDTMVSNIKIWLPNYASYQIKEALNLNLLCDVITEKGFQAKIFHDTEEEAMVLQVTTDEGTFDIAPGFNMLIEGQEQIMVYRENINIYHDGQGSATTALLWDIIDNY